MYRCYSKPALMKIQDGDSAGDLAFSRGRRGAIASLDAGEHKFDLKQAQVVGVRNGLAFSLRTYFDRMDLMAQLGLLPRPAAAKSQ